MKVFPLTKKVFALFMLAQVLFACNSNGTADSTADSTDRQISSTAAPDADKAAPDSAAAVNQEIAALIVANQKSRIRDSWGSGQFSAQRDGGTRKHSGLDVVAQPGENIYAPFDGQIVREAVAYNNDKSYRGVVLRGTGSWALHEIKILYVEGIISGGVTKGQLIGTAQNLTTKYPGITNHVHVEVTKAGAKIDPFEIWQMSM